MKRFSRWIFIVCILVLASGQCVYGGVWEFGTSGSSNNPFVPRGFLVRLENGSVQWLGNQYNNSSKTLRYSGVHNGIDYLEATKSDGSNYTFYAMTERNPSPGKGYLVVYKNHSAISLSSYTKAPIRGRDGLGIDPSGANTCHGIPIEGLKLEPGCKYEFAFLQGMEAENGITLVLAPGEHANRYKGYIKLSEGYTSEEKGIYDNHRNQEYQFVQSWSKDAKTGEFTVNLIPMRFSVQTYADLAIWEQAEKEVNAFLGSVTAVDYGKGTYRKENVQALKSLLKDQQKEIKDNVRILLQPEANAKMKTMAANLRSMLQKAKTEKPVPADLKKLQQTIMEAKDLYAKVKDNTGTEKGQYGALQVEDLKDEITAAGKLDKFSPQGEINKQVRKLEDAMIEVKASFVEENMLRLYDPVTGICVWVSETAVPADTTLAVRRIAENNQVLKQVKSNLSEEMEQVAMYDVQLYHGEKKIQPKKAAQVEIPIDDKISEKNTTVYSVGNNGTVAKLQSITANGVQKFGAKTLERFALAGSTASEAEKAKRRSDRMVQVTARKNDDQGTNKENKVQQTKKEKEVFQDPLDQLLLKSENTATFSNDVTRKTDPVYLIFCAAALAAVAFVLGAKTVIKMGREKKRDEI